MRYILITVFIIGLTYILTPDPSSIDQFAPIPNSLKSSEPGDTVQVPNIAAYFSQFNREEITNFYKNEYRNKFWFGRLIPPITLNYPPRSAWDYVRDRQQSTFLEEYIYPLHPSIFVNGYEVYTVNELIGRAHDPKGDHMEIKGQYFASKTTIRMYPVHWLIKLIIYVGIWAGIIALFKVFKEIKKV